MLSVPRSLCSVASAGSSSLRLTQTRLRLANIFRHFSDSALTMAPTAKQYDFIVIGGGSGGSGAARRAAGWYGTKTLLVEKSVSFHHEFVDDNTDIYAVENQAGLV